MGNTFGMEIEFFIPDNKNRIKYVLQHYSLIACIGVDGIGDLVGEIRTPVFNSYNSAYIYIKTKYHYLNIDYEILATPYETYKCIPCDKIHKLPMGFHFSIGKIKKLPIILLYLIMPIIILIYDRDIFIKYCRRFIIYPDIYRIHRNRTEIRFIPNSFKVIKPSLKILSKLSNI